MGQPWAGAGGDDRHMHIQNMVTARVGGTGVPGTARAGSTQAQDHRGQKREEAQRGPAGGRPLGDPGLLLPVIFQTLLDRSL